MNLKLLFNVYLLITFFNYLNSVDILNREYTYCNENNLADLVCIPRYDINNIIDEVIEKSLEELNPENPEPLIIYNKLDFIKNPLYSCNHYKSRLIELDPKHKTFICVYIIEVEKALQCESGYKLTEILVENPSNKLGYADAEIRRRSYAEKKYAIKSDKLCIRTVEVPVNITCTEGHLKDGFCVEDITFKPIYECPIGFHVTPKKWCGYLRKDLGETLMENIIKRTNPGCVIKTIHPWFKSTARVECYNNKKYTVGITEEDWVNVMPATIKCPLGFEIVYPKYSTEEEIKGSIILPPICLSRKYFPRKLICAGRLLRNGLIVVDRSIVDKEINSTPFKQNLDISNYTCQIQDRMKPSIVCPFYTDEIKKKRNKDLSNNNDELNNLTQEVLRYQSGITDFITYSNFLKNNNIENNNDSLQENIVNNSNSTNLNVTFYNNNNYKNEFHMFNVNNSDYINNHLRSTHNYDEESSFYPFRINMTLDNPWNNDLNKHNYNSLRRVTNKDHNHNHHIGESDTYYTDVHHFKKAFKKYQSNLKYENTGEYYNDYQWNFLSRFFKVYVSNQYKFISNIPISSISHKAFTIDGEYFLNVNLDPTYQSFINFTIEKINENNFEKQLNDFFFPNYTNEINNTQISENNISNYSNITKAKAEKMNNINESIFDVINTITDLIEKNDINESISDMINTLKSLIEKNNINESIFGVINTIKEFEENSTNEHRNLSNYINEYNDFTDINNKFENITGYFNKYEIQKLSNEVEDQIKQNNSISNSTQKVNNTDINIDIGTDLIYNNTINKNESNITDFNSNVESNITNYFKNNMIFNNINIEQIKEIDPLVLQKTIFENQRTEYQNWEKSAKVYYMNLDLMKRNQILYSSINQHSRKKNFPYIYYSGPPILENYYGHVRRPAISDQKYRFGSPSENYYRYTGRYEKSDIAYYIHKYFNYTKPYRHSPGPQNYYNCISINETVPIVECSNQTLIIPRCFILDIIYIKIINFLNEISIQNNNNTNVTCEKSINYNNTQIRTENFF